jgi:hypothetical protein
MYTDKAIRWRARPLIAATTRGVAFALPIALSAGAVYCASRLVPPPTGSLLASVVWWIGVSGPATVVLFVAGRLSRRLLPLAGLMRLSLVFPDCAPSRFKVAMRQGTLETLEQRLAAARNGWPDVAPVEAARRLLELVALLDTHDRLTRGHAERVRAYAQAIGRELGLERRDLDLLNWAALLHDIGKLEVPTEILTKNRKPGPQEWEILKRHPELGDALIGPVREWLGEWSAAVVEHHERWDGAGYPRGLAGADISLAGRIVAVADAFDVITSTRSYKEAFTPAAAREEITRGAGTQFDPDVVRALLAISVRGSRTTGALAWLAQAPVLGKVALVPTATTLSAAAVGLGISDSNGFTPRAAAPVERTVRASASNEPNGTRDRLVVAPRPRVANRAHPSTTRTLPSRGHQAPEPVDRRTRVKLPRPTAPPPVVPAHPVPPAPVPAAPSGDTTHAEIRPVAATPSVVPSVPLPPPLLPLPPPLPPLPTQPAVPALVTDAVPSPDVIPNLDIPPIAPTDPVTQAAPPTSLGLPFP